MMAAVLQGYKISTLYLWQVFPQAARHETKHNARTKWNWWHLFHTTLVPVYSNGITKVMESNVCYCNCMHL